MANIKISELNELQTVDNDDLLVVVDVSANETKKVQARNVGTGGGGSDVVVISDTEPTNPDTKIWIDTGEVQNLGSEVHIGDTIDSKVGLNILMGKNLFNKNNANIINGSFSSTDAISINNNVKSVYIECKPNTTYTISKSNVTNRFRAGTTSVVPASGVSVSNVVTNDSGTTITLTSGSSAKYLIVYYWTNGDSTDVVLNSLQIEYGSTATTYQSYITPTINVYGEDIYSVPQVLWTNPSPNAEFGSQNITLSSDDYGYLEVLYTAQGSNEQYIKSTGKIPKGKDIKIDDIYIQQSNTNAIRIYSRLLSYTNDTTFSVNSARFASSFTSSEANNNFAIPYKIIGYKE